MATAQFHSVRGSKSALVAVRPNEFQFGNTFVYISRAGVASALKMTAEELESKDWDDELTFAIPDGYRVVDITDEEGNVRTTKSGEALKTLVW